jgi:hypothetical protein
MSTCGFSLTVKRKTYETPFHFLILPFHHHHRLAELLNLRLRFEPLCLCVRDEQWQKPQSKKPEMGKFNYKERFLPSAFADKSVVEWRKASWVCLQTSSSQRVGAFFISWLLSFFFFAPRSRLAILLYCFFDWF